MKSTTAEEAAGAFRPVDVVDRGERHPHEQTGGLRLGLEEYLHPDGGRHLVRRQAEGEHDEEQRRRRGERKNEFHGLQGE
jgi:hypothetical protein